MKSNKQLLITPLSNIPATEVSFVLSPYLPRGKQTLLVGDPGDGKTWIAIDICARITRGWDLPADIPIEDELTQSPTVVSQPGKALYISGEDGAADTLKPRFTLQGGDDTKLFIVNGVIEEHANGTRHYSLRLSDLGPLEEAIKEIQPDIVVVDPIQAFMSGKVDLHRANEVREALQGITKLAERYSFALLIVCHLNKSVQAKAIHRVLGSIDLVAGARSVLLAAPHRDDGKYAMAHLKCSVGRKGSTRLYTIDDDGLHWIGVDSRNADDLLTASHRGTKQADAQALLKELLSTGPKASKDVLEIGAKRGLTEYSLRSAAETLGVVKKPSEFRGQWLWSLPASGDSMGQPIPVEDESSGESTPVSLTTTTVEV